MDQETIVRCKQCGNDLKDFDRENSAHSNLCFLCSEKYLEYAVDSAGEYETDEVRE